MPREARALRGGARRNRRTGGLGGRGTLLGAGFGGHEGRALRRGDVLSPGNAPVRERPLPPGPDLAAPLRVVPGPDLDRFETQALDLLLSTAYVVDAHSDRTGIRLAGPPISRVDGDSGVSAPMVRGAVQIPPSGCPVVLGPDHPTTGGYPVLATVTRTSLGVLGALPVGAVVRFERDAQHLRVERFQSGRKGTLPDFASPCSGPPRPLVQGRNR